MSLPHPHPTPANISSMYSKPLVVNDLSLTGNCPFTVYSVVDESSEKMDNDFLNEIDRISIKNHQNFMKST